MTVPEIRPVENRVLAQLPPQEYKRLLPHLEPVALEFKQVLCEPGETIEHAYFPLSGVVSHLAHAGARANVEVAMIGNEGMVGCRAFLGADTCSTQTLVQIPGRALRMKA